MSEERRSWAAMGADALREAAVLVLVFGVLDKYVVDRDGPSAGWTAVVVAVSLLTFGMGGILERSRRM